MKNSDITEMPIELIRFGQYAPETHLDLTKREQVLKDFMAAMLSNPEMDYNYAVDGDALADDASKFVDSYFKKIEEISK